MGNFILKKEEMEIRLERDESESLAYLYSTSKGSYRSKKKNHKSLDDDEVKEGIFAGSILLALPPLAFTLLALALALLALALSCPCLALLPLASLALS